MKTSNSIIENMASVRAAARRLNCTVVAVLDNVILCHRSDNTFITWRCRIVGGFAAERAEFISGCYDMTADAARSNLLDRAWEITL